MALTINALADEASPQTIAQKVVKAYKDLNTYQSEGKILSTIKTGGQEHKTETSFSIRMKKPNMYRISWIQKDMPMPGMHFEGAVWSDGTQPYLYMGMAKAYYQFDNDEYAISSATGISGGAASTIPSLFLNISKQHTDILKQLAQSKLQKSELVEGDDCYVLSGSSDFSLKETYWISKKTFLIRQYHRSLESPKGGRISPKMTDQEVKESLKGMGVKVTPKNIQKMKTMMEENENRVADIQLKGFTIEFQSHISSPDFKKADFLFKMPAEATLKDSLFGNIFDDGEDDNDAKK